MNGGARAANRGGAENAGLRAVPPVIPSGAQVQTTSVPVIPSGAQRSRGIFPLAQLKWVKRMNQYFVYMLTNWNDKVMYIGVTNNLERRLYEHKNELIDGFTKTYHVHKLVYFEETSDVNAALEREKQMKRWRREKKNALVETMNPTWRDLSEDWE